MKRRKLWQHLQQQGCIMIREGKAHSQFINPANNRRTSVPRHGEIEPFLVKKICKQLDIPVPSER